MPYMFHVITAGKPSRKVAANWDRIARSLDVEGGFVEVNVTGASAPGVNLGRYQGWFEIRSRGAPFDEQKAAAILKACGLA